MKYGLNYIFFVVYFFFTKCGNLRLNQGCKFNFFGNFLTVSVKMTGVKCQQFLLKWSDPMILRML